jgi:cytoskeletal protein CcmA (bactofilin family)
MASKMKENGSDLRQTNELNFIGSGTYVDGSIEAKGSLRIDGRVKGAVKAADTLTIGAKGEVAGEIHARMAVVGGRVEGDIRVQEKLVLEANSVVVGNLKAKKLVIDDGAIFQGKSDMGASKTIKTSPEPIQFQPEGEKADVEKSAETKS